MSEQEELLEEIGAMCDTAIKTNIKQVAQIVSLKYKLAQAIEALEKIANDDDKSFMIGGTEAYDIAKEVLEKLKNN